MIFYPLNTISWKVCDVINQQKRITYGSYDESTTENRSYLIILEIPRNKPGMGILQFSTKYRIPEKSKRHLQTKGARE